MPCILGIETSCDETAAAVVAQGRLVLSSVVASQHDLHERFAGVVPEIASRAHLERILPVIDEALDEADVTLADIDAIAVGNRPGLIGSLLVGVSAAKALAWATDKPLIGVDHVQAHLYAAALYEGSDEAPAPQYPALGLVVSGGHTALYEVTGPTEMRRMGSTIDDAVGEAYDKAAVILHLGYPGGPALDRLAPQGDANAFQLPRSLLGPESLDFSFSGLKTALLYQVRGQPERIDGKTTFPRSGDDLTNDQRRDLAASFQAAAVDVLIIKLKRALERLRRGRREPASLLIGGGVCANSLLRQRAVEFGHEHGLATHLPPMAWCVDNAAMIAGLARHFLAAGCVSDLDLAPVATTST